MPHNFLYESMVDIIVVMVDINNVKVLKKFTKGGIQVFENSFYSDFTKFKKNPVDYKHTPD